MDYFSTNLKFVFILGFLWTGLLENAYSFRIPECSKENNPVKQCTVAVSNLETMNTESLLMDSAKLSHVCRLYEEATECITSYVTRCFGGVSATFYRHLSSGLQQFLGNFCDENSEFNEEYIRRYRKCYKSLNDERKSCDLITDAHRRIREEKLSGDDSKRIVCCSITSTLECNRDLITSRCSSEDADFIDGVYSRILGETMISQCQPFDLEKSQCNGIIKIKTTSRPSDVIPSESDTTTTRPDLLPTNAPANHQDMPNQGSGLVQRLALVLVFAYFASNFK